MAKQLLKRSEVKVENTWCLEDIYPSVNDYEKEIEVLTEKIKRAAGFKGKLLENSESLLNAFKLMDEIGVLVDRIVCYSHQRLDQDTSDSLSQELKGKADIIITQVGEAVAFFEPEILEASEEKIRNFIKENEGLKLYEKELNFILRKKEHMLDAEKEALLASESEIFAAPKKIFSLFNNADLKFGTVKGEDGKEVVLTHGNYIRFLESKNRDVRRDAFKTLYKSYKGFENTLSANYEARVKVDVFEAKARKFGSSLEAALFGGNIPTSVYDNLISTVHEGLPIMYRFVKLRKKALKLDELHMYDMHTSLVSDFDMKIPFDKAKEIVKEGLAPLGKDYIALLDTAFNNRWIDVYENEGKRSGAYSWGPYGVHPYVLLNHQDNLDSVFTVAHELGHAMHSYKSYHAQPYVYAHYKIFVAEVASTCNEALLNFHLIGKAKDKKEKAYLINNLLDSFKGTVFRQTMFAEFEKKAHEMAENGEPLTAKALNEMYLELNKLYFGPDAVVDEDIANEWSRIPHFYTPFYVYQYATGFSAAIAIAQKILKEGRPAVDNYFKFLSSGGSDFPIELLKIAGVDMSKPDAIRTGFKVFSDMLDEMEKLIG